MSFYEDKPIPEISWFTPPVGEGVGYGYAAVETIKAIQRRGVKVSYDQLIPKVHINFVQPDYYHGIYDQFRIGYTPWESDTIPDHWISHMQEMDEIWTPCNYNRDLYLSAGVNDVIRVVPHGIDQEVWKIESRYVRDNFIFLHVGGPTQRKGGQRVVDAFLELYGDNEDVYLILKSNGVSECRFTDKHGQFLNAMYHPRIVVVEENLDVYDLVKLYNKAHCLVYPTNGEGFGLIPFQGIATGLPTIVTDATACADYANLSVPLKSTPHPGQGIHLGDWVEPDLDHLREQMRYVFENYDQVAEKTNQSARIIHSTQTWDHVGEQIINILGDKIYEKV